jgi:cysteine synthase A
MAESFSVERRKLKRFLGAKVVLTPAAMGATGMLNKTIELATTHGWYLTRQFENDANPEIHERTTAREILADFADETLDYWVTGYGTGGTLQGVARVLVHESPATRIIVAEPDGASLLASGAPQPHHADGTPDGRHPAWTPHPMQGWTPDFIPKITADAVAMKLVHQLVTVTGAEALACSRDLARTEGIFVGITSGATFAATLQVAAAAKPGANVLCMLPDTGERYLSTPLFSDISADMTEEETAIFRSTPLGLPTALTK